MTDHNREEREALIEKANDALADDTWVGYSDDLTRDDLTMMVQRVWAVFEQAHIPTDDEREALDRAIREVTWNASNYPRKAQPHILGADIGPLTKRIVDSVEAAGFRRPVQGAHGELGGAIPLYGMLDVWMALYGTSHPEFDEFYAEHGYAETWSHIVASVRERRPVHGSGNSAQNSDHEREAPIEEVAAAFQQHEGAPTWKDDPVARDAALRWHMRGFKDGMNTRRPVQGEPSGIDPTDDDIRLATLAAVKKGAKSDADAVRNFREAERVIRAAIPHLRRTVQGEPTDAMENAAIGAFIKSAGVHPGRVHMRAALRAAFKEGEN